MANPPEMHAAAVRFASQGGIKPLPRESYAILTEEMMTAYLSLLQLSPEDVQTPTLDVLTKLQLAHCDLISYGNLDLYAAEDGSPLPLPALGPLHSVERVLAGWRSGYCFLVVDAFAALLSTLGFRVSLHTAGVGDDPLPPEKWGNHMLLCVRRGTQESRNPLLCWIM